jgi:hypothetical protein
LIQFYLRWTVWRLLPVDRWFSLGNLFICSRWTMVWPDQNSNSRSTTFETITLTITPPIQFLYFQIVEFGIE